MTITELKFIGKNRFHLAVKYFEHKASGDIYVMFSSYSRFDVIFMANTMLFSGILCLRNNKGFIKDGLILSYAKLRVLL